MLCIYNTLRWKYFTFQPQEKYPLNVRNTTIITENYETSEKLHDVTYNSNSPSLALPRVRLRFKSTGNVYAKLNFRGLYAARRRVFKNVVGLTLSYLNFIAVYMNATWAMHQDS